MMGNFYSFHVVDHQSLCYGSEQYLISEDIIPCFGASPQGAPFPPLPSAKRSPNRPIALQIRILVDAQRSGRERKSS